MQRESAGGAPFVLNVQAVVGVVQFARSLISDAGEDSPTLVNRGIQCGLSKVAGGIEPLEEDHERGPCGESLRAGCGGSDAGKVGFKGIEKWKRLYRVDAVIVAPEADGVLAMIPGQIVHDFVAAFFVDVWIAAVDSNGEDVAYLEVGLRSVGREIKSTMGVLHADFIGQTRGEGGGEAADKRLVAEKVVFK